MLSLKLQRIGRRHQPAYRVVVAESRSKLIAPPIEDMGSYNPFTKALQVKNDRIKHWISVGAQPTVTVHNLLAKAGIIEAKPKKLAMPAKQVTAEAEAGA
jgi:small subunit ribosomal protein S16